jgi:hypothetical protein
VNYRDLHKWVEQALGKPSSCEKCGTTEDRRYHWANVSGSYKRELSDWRRLCVSCHKTYDLNRLGGKNPNKITRPICKKGHKFNEANTRWRVRGTSKWRVCRQCQSLYMLNFRLRMEVKNGGH